MASWPARSREAAHLKPLHLVFAAPLLAFLLLFVLHRRRFTARIERVNAWLRRWLPRIVKYGSVTVGGALAAYAGAALSAPHLR
jgi:fructose-specific phosphotransferase system IIC component